MAKARTLRSIPKQLATSRSRPTSAKTWLAFAVVACLALGLAFWARAKYTIDPAVLARNEEGVRLMQAGREGQAAAIWMNLIAKDPSYPNPYVQLADYYNAMG